MLPRDQRPRACHAIPTSPSPRTRVGRDGTTRARAMPSMAVLLATLAGTPAGVSRPHSKGGVKPLSHAGRRHFWYRSPSRRPGRACFLEKGGRGKAARASVLPYSEVEPLQSCPLRIHASANFRPMERVQERRRGERVPIFKDLPDGLPRLVSQTDRINERSAARLLAHAVQHLVVPVADHPDLRFGRA